MLTKTQYRPIRGFTLIELVISIGIFSLLMTVVFGLFMASLANQRRIFSANSLLSQVSYAQEYMFRAIRLARKDLNGICIPAKTNFQVIPNRLRFLNYKTAVNECQEFYVSIGQLMETKTTPSGGAVTGALTSDKFEITSFNITLSGENQTDNIQPRVTIFWSIRPRGTKPEFQHQLSIQTTISQRNLDVRY